MTTVSHAAAVDRCPRWGNTLKAGIVMRKRLNAVRTSILSAERSQAGTCQGRLSLN